MAWRYDNLSLINPNLMKSNPNAFLSKYLCALVLVSLVTPPAVWGGFHLWEISEVYSSADGSVQFVEMRAQSGGQQFFKTFGGNSPVVRSTNSLGTSTVLLTNDLPGSSSGRTCLIGTANLATLPGGVTPDFIIPPGFIRRATNGGAAVVLFNPNSTFGLVTTNLPADGISALVRSGSSALVVPTNSPKNFQLQSNSIVPTRFASATQNGDDLVINFGTATGVNGGAGPNYAIEGSGALNAVAWSVVTNVSGDGSTKSVALPIDKSTNQVFRLRVP